MERASRDTIYLDMASLMSFRSTCNRAKVGCIFTVDNRIVCTGYNGAPSGMAHCLDVGCDVNEGGGCERCLHAEASAISFAARKGISLEGCKIYLTHAPCYSCAKLLINVGVKEVIYIEPYRDQRGLDLLYDIGVVLKRLIGKNVFKVAQKYASL